MPVEVAVWRVDQGISPVIFEPMADEARLEEILRADISLVAPHLMVIGQQVPTGYGHRIDLLAIASDGSLAVLELKRDRTPRDVVAQLLDYGSWVQSLSVEEIVRIWDEDQLRRLPAAPRVNFEDAFRARFRLKTSPDEFNTSHELILVASALDPQSERVVSYLAHHGGVRINAVFFRFFRDGDREYLSRAWLRDPTSSDIEAGPEAEREPWNGEVYVSFGLEDVRDWDEAVRFGFVSAGGGTWYTNTLASLEPGQRVWINVPGTGYVGVGEVEQSVVPVEEFLVKTDSEEGIPITSLDVKVARATKSVDDREKAEFLARVRWLHTVPVAEAVHERGFFGNQNTVARPRTPKWAYTVERLKKRFNVA